MKFLPAASTSTAAPCTLSEILASAQTRKFLDSLRNSYDYIFVDFSPLMPIVDVRVSTNLVDGYIFVVAWGDTRIEFVKAGAAFGQGRPRAFAWNRAQQSQSNGDRSIRWWRWLLPHGNYARYGYTE